MTELEQKRVDVARDALVQAKIITVEADSGYLCIWSDGRCEACALGAMFLGMVAKGQDLFRRFGGGPGIERIEEALETLWSPMELGAIECAFEGWDFEAWRIAIPGDRDRLIAILQNIVRNSGTFIPSDIRPIEPDAPTIPSMDFHEPQMAPMLTAHQLQL